MYYSSSNGLSCQSPRCGALSTSIASLLRPPYPHRPEPEPLLLGSSTALLPYRQRGLPCPDAKVSVVREARDHDAVIRIAHLGDCMGMIVWGTALSSVARTLCAS